MKKLMKLIAYLLMTSLFTGMASYGFESNYKTWYIHDKQGNINGSIRTYNQRTRMQFDKNGNHTRTYRQIGNMIYVYDKQGNCVGSYRR